MDLSVVVVNWNSGGHLERLLNSLKPLADETAQILVVDNDSRDLSWKVADSTPNTHIVRLDTNQGFAGGANIGFRKCDTEFVLLLNPDIEIRPESIRKLYRRISERHDAAIVCGPLIGLEGKDQEEFQLRPLPNWWSVLKDAVFLDELASKFQRESRESASDSSPRVVEQPAAAFWLMRKAAWTALDGFDERFHPAWFEDVDFCKRLAQSDWKILFYPDCPVVHSGGASLEHLGYRVFCQLYYTNLLRYLRKHHPFSHVWLWLPVNVGMILRSWRRLT